MNFIVTQTVSPPVPPTWEMMIGLLRNIRILLSIEWPEGKFCILANGRCPRGFRRHEGHLKSLYLCKIWKQFYWLLWWLLWTIRQFHWLSHFDHVLQIEDLWRSHRITNKTTRKIKDKKFSITMRLIEQRLKVSGSAISNCEDHSSTKIYFKLKKKIRLCLKFWLWFYHKQEILFWYVYPHQNYICLVK